MIVADFHVHSTFSVDGISTMEQHCIAAIQKGIKKICFTEHVDYNIAEYNVGKVKDNRKQNFDIKEYFNEMPQQKEQNFLGDRLLNRQRRELRKLILLRR